MSGFEFVMGVCGRNKKFTGIFLEKIAEGSDIGTVRNTDCSLIDNLIYPALFVIRQLILEP